MEYQIVFGDYFISIDKDVMFYNNVLLFFFPVDMEYQKYLEIILFRLISMLCFTIMYCYSFLCRFFSQRMMYYDLIKYP